MTRHIFSYKKIIALGLFALACHAPVAQAMDGGSWWKNWKIAAAVGAVAAAAGTALYGVYKYRTQSQPQIENPVARTVAGMVPGLKSLKQLALEQSINYLLSNECLDMLCNPETYQTYCDKIGLARRLSEDLDISKKFIQAVQQDLFWRNSLGIHCYKAEPVDGINLWNILSISGDDNMHLIAYDVDRQWGCCYWNKYGKWIKIIKGHTKKKYDEHCCVKTLNGCGKYPYFIRNADGTWFLYTIDGQCIASVSQNVFSQGPWEFEEYYTINESGTRIIVYNKRNHFAYIWDITRNIRAFDFGDDIAYCAAGKSYIAIVQGSQRNIIQIFDFDGNHISNIECPDAIQFININESEDIILGGSSQYYYTWQISSGKRIGQHERSTDKSDVCNRYSVGSKYFVQGLDEQRGLQQLSLVLRDMNGDQRAVITCPFKVDFASMSSDENYLVTNHIYKALLIWHVFPDVQKFINNEMTIEQAHVILALLRGKRTLTSLPKHLWAIYDSMPAEVCKRVVQVLAEQDESRLERLRTWMISESD